MGEKTAFAVIGNIHVLLKWTAVPCSSARGIICLVRAGDAELDVAAASVNIFPCRGSEMVLV